MSSTENLSQPRTRRSIMRPAYRLRRDPYFDFPPPQLDREYEVIPPADTRRCVTNTTAFPFRFICNIEGITGRGPFCTATLIGPRTAISAGHCLFDEVLSVSEPPGNLRIIPGRNGAATLPEPLGSSLGAAIQLAPGFVSGNDDTDYAIVILKDPIGNSTGWRTFDSNRASGDPLGTSIVAADELFPNSGAQLDVAGYPGDLPADPAGRLGQPPDPCFRPSVPQGTVQYHDRNGFARISANGLRLQYFTDTASGMSGAPVWVERGPEQGGRVMVGIHTAGTVAVNSGILIGGTAPAFIRSHSFPPQGGTPPGRPQVKLGSKGATVIELQYRLNIFLAVNATGLAP